MDIEKLNNAFDSYVNNFDMSNDMINLKYWHTYRVCHLAKNLAKSLNMNEEDSYLSYVCSLLHDIGRFEQVRKYNTFDDFISIDHGDYACDLLFKDGLISSFNIDEKYYEIIEKSIRYHNKYEIGPCSDRELLFSKFVRDVDKLDILYNAAYLGYIKFDTDELGPSKDAIEDFNNKRCVYHLHKKNKSDKAMVFLSFIFDINFNYSYKYLKENKILEKIYEKIENKELLEEYFIYAIKYVEGKCNSGN